MPNSPKPQSCDLFGKHPIVQARVGHGGDISQSSAVSYQHYCKGAGEGGTNTIDPGQIQAQCNGDFRKCGIWKNMQEAH